MGLLLIVIAATPLTGGAVCAAVVGGPLLSRFLAFVLGILLTGAVTWFAGRVDERPVEGVVAGTLILIDLGLLASLRRHYRSTTSARGEPQPRR